MNVDMLAVRYLDQHPQAALRALREVPEEELGPFVAGLAAERQDRVLTGLPPDIAGEVLLALPDPARAACLERLPLQAVSRIVRRADGNARARLIDAMPAARRRRIERAVRFGDHTAGAAADPEAPTVTDMHEAAAALRLGQKRAPGLPSVFVTDREGRLTGVASKDELRRAPDGARVADVMQPEVHSVSAFAPLATLWNHPAWLDVDVLPVVDATGALVGVLRHRELRRRLATASPSGAAAPAADGALALGTAYCDLLARALVSVTTGPPRAPAGSTAGGPA